MAVKYPLIQHMSVSLHACVPVVSVIVKRTVFPPCAVDGCSRNPLYYYYCSQQSSTSPPHYLPPPHTAQSAPGAEQLTPTLHLLLKSCTAERMPAELKCPALAISLPCSTMVCMVSASKLRSISSAWCFFSSSFTPRRSDPRSGLATDFSISTNLSCTTGGTTGAVHLVTEEFCFQFVCSSYLRMKKRKK